MKQQLGMLQEKDIEPIVQSVSNSTKYLSNTIDDFRNFFKTDKEKELFNLSDALNKSLNIVGSKFKSYDIELIQTQEDVVVENYENELIQVLMNLLNNAKEQFLAKEIQRRLLFINIYAKDKNAYIQIKDNALGIDAQHIERIFEPYFTTKHKAQGTGIGLHMSREIIVKHMKGNIQSQNVAFTYEKQKYKGALFTITLPLK